MMNMKNEYKAPKANLLPVESDGLLATSDGDSVKCRMGNSRPTSDTEENFFSNQRGAEIWE